MSETIIEPRPSKISHRKRYQQILTTFAKHGFGYILTKLQLRRSLLPPEQTETKIQAEDLISQAVHFRLALEELGPTFIKVGQILSTRPDLLKPEFIQELAKLEDSVPPEPWEAIHAIMVEELGEEPENIFKEIETIPLAAASLGQVHHAKLKSGRNVVIKVQRPNIQSIIDVDLSILEDMAVLAERTSWGERNHPTDIIRNFAESLRNELDYYREGRNADRFRNNFSGDERLHIPKIYWNYTTKRVLVMEELHGIKITDIDAIEKAGISRKKIAENAAAIIVKEILQDGFYHADPHGGNFLVLEGGVIGVMDFGMVGELHPRDRESLTRMYVNAIAMDSEGIVDELFRMAAIENNTDRNRLEEDIDHMLRKYAGLPLKDMRMQDILQDLTAIVSRYNLTLPADFWMLGKTMGMMEGLGLKLNPDFDIFSISEPIVRKLRLEMLRPKKEWGRYLVHEAMDFEAIARLLPRASRRLIERIDKNQPLEMSIVGSDKAIKTMSAQINRLSLSIGMAGLVIAIALLITASQLKSLILAAIIIIFLVILLLSVGFLFSRLRRR